MDGDKKISCLELEVELSTVQKQRVRIRVINGKYEVTVMLPEGPLGKVFGKELEELNLQGIRPIGLQEYHYKKIVDPVHIGRFVHTYDKLVKKYAEPMTPRFTHEFFLFHAINRLAVQEKEWDENTSYDSIGLRKIVDKYKVSLN